MEKQTNNIVHYQYNDDDDNEALYLTVDKEDYEFNKFSVSRNKIEGYPIGTVFSLFYRLLSEILPLVRNTEAPEEYTPLKVMAMVEEMIDKKGLYKCIDFSKSDPDRITLIKFFMHFWNLANKSQYFIEQDQIWSLIDYITNSLESSKRLSLDKFHLFCSSKNLPITGFNRKYHPETDGKTTTLDKETPYFAYEKETDEMHQIPWQTIIESTYNENDLLKKAQDEYEADMLGDPIEEDEPDTVTHVSSGQLEAYYEYDCEVNSFQEFFSATIQAIIEQHYNVLRCGCCREIFVAHRNDAKFCDFACPQKPKMICKDYMNYIGQIQKRQSNIRTRAFTKVVANVRSKTEMIIDPNEQRQKRNMFLDENEIRRPSIDKLEDYNEIMEKTYDYLSWLSSKYSRKYNHNLEAFIIDLCSLVDGSDKDKEQAKKDKIQLLEIHRKRKEGM